MADAFIGEIRTFPYNYTPEGWLLCDGSTYRIQEYSPLFAVIGITYGGDGRHFFNVPNLLGQSALGAGSGGIAPNMPTSIAVGSHYGSNTTTLSLAQMPPHTHQVHAAINPTLANYSDTPGPDKILSRTLGTEGTGTPYKAWSNQKTPETTMHPDAISATGNGQPHENLQPGLTLLFCICHEGTFPQRP
ncbi:MAG: tail fiber protein [Rhodospirillaceae bacterium]|nr:tail fiber protein [Rhodospirillaceae bacterium]